MGSPHFINGFVLQWMFQDKILIKYPDGRELWTGSFKVVREEMGKKEKSNQLELF